MANTRHFNRTVSTWGNVTRRRDAAYAALGLEPLNASDAVSELLAAVPSPEAVATQLAIEAATTTDAARWWRDAQQRLETAQHAATLRHALARNLEAVNRAHATAMTTEATNDLRPGYLAAVDSLKAAAVLLPREPFDLDAVIAADATAAMKKAIHALSILGIIASIHEQRGSALPTVAAVLPVVDSDDIEPLEVGRIDRVELNPCPVRDQIKSFVMDLAANDVGIDVALVNVARGDYGPHVRFTLATDRAELARRGERFDRAGYVHVVDSGGYKRPTARALA